MRRVRTGGKQTGVGGVGGGWKRVSRVWQRRSRWRTPVFHMCTQAASDLFGQAKDARRLGIPDILRILQPLFYKRDRLSSTSPTAESIAGHTKDPPPPGPHPPVCSICEGLHMCVRSRMWFFLRGGEGNALCAASALRYFPRVPFRLVLCHRGHLVLL